MINLRTKLYLLSNKHKWIKRNLFYLLYQTKTWNKLSWNKINITCNDTPNSKISDNLFLFKNASVLSNSMVITQDNKIPYKICQEYAGEPYWHRACEIKKLPPPIYINNDILALPSPCDNYYHWVMDGFSRLACLPKDFYKNKKIITSHSLNYQLQYLELLGISKENLLSTNEWSHYKSNNVYVPFNEDIQKTVNFLKKLKTFSINTKKLFIPRKQGSRGIINLQEISTILKTIGFDVIEPSILSAKEQIDIFSNAEIVIGSHGAALTNIVYCNENTKIIELYPENLEFPCHYQNISKACNLQYQKVSCHCENKKSLDYFVNAQKLLLLI